MSLQEGIYKGHLQKVTLGETKTGKPQIVYEFITDGILDSSGEFLDCANVNRTIFRVLTENTIDFATAELRQLGYDRDNFDDIDPESPNAFDFDGIEVTVEMKLEEYEGRQRERWQFTRKGQGKKLEQSGVSKLNAMFGSKLKSSRPDGATRAPVARVASTRPKAGASVESNGEQDTDDNGDPISF